MRSSRAVARTLVFIPAWNEEENLPDVLAEARAELPDADVLVVDDGSTDSTADVARAGGATVLSFGENRGLRAAIAAGYRYAHEQGYDVCGRIDADGQHPPAELGRLLARVVDGKADVAVGSRFAAGEGYAARRYLPSRDRALGISLLRRLVGLRLGRPFADATSGLYAVGPRALPVLAEQYVSGAPEVEALIRISEAGLTLEEVAVDMRERARGESKLQGKKALKLVLTVGTVLLLGRRFLRLFRRLTGRA